MIYRMNSDGEMESTSSAYVIQRQWIPIRSVQPYAGNYTPVRSVSPYAGNYTPVRTVKGFETVRILPGGGNQPSLPDQAGSIVGGIFAGVNGPVEKEARMKKLMARMRSSGFPIPDTTPVEAPCTTCGTDIPWGTILIVGGVGVGAYWLYKNSKKPKGIVK